MRELRQDAALAQELGFEAAFVEAVPLAARAGVRFANQAKFHPLRYVAALLPRIPGDGCHVFEKSEASEFQEDPLGVKANGSTVKCADVVIATHVPLMGNTGLMGTA